MSVGSDGSPLRAAALLVLATLAPAAESQSPSIRPPSPFAVSTHDRWADLSFPGSSAVVRIAWSGDVYRTELDVVPVVRREATSTIVLGSEVPVAIASSLVYTEERASAPGWAAVIDRERVVFEDRGGLLRIALAPSGEWFVYQDQGSPDLEVRSSADAKVIAVFPAPDPEVRQIGFSWKSDAIYLHGPDDDVEVVEVPSGRRRFVPRSRDFDRVLAIDARRFVGLRAAAIEFFEDDVPVQIVASETGYDELHGYTVDGSVLAFGGSHLDLVTPRGELVFRFGLGTKVAIGGELFDAGRDRWSISLLPNGAILLGDHPRHEWVLFFEGVRSDAPLDWGGDPSSVRIATDALGSATSAEARRLPPGARVYGGGRAVGWRHADGTFDLEELARPAND